MEHHHFCIDEDTELHFTEDVKDQYANWLASMGLEKNVIPEQLKERMEHSDIYEETVSVISDIIENKISLRLNLWSYFDVGCGNGILTRDISNEIGVLMRCCDIKDSRIIKSPYEYEEFYVFDGMNIPVGSSEFQVVTCLLSLHHSTTPYALLEEIYRVLSPGGILIIKEFDCQDYNHVMLCEYMHESSDPDSTTKGVRSYRPIEGWREIASSTGFEICGEVYFLDHFRMYIDVFQKPGV